MKLITKIILSQTEANAFCKVMNVLETIRCLSEDTDVAEHAEIALTEIAQIYDEIEVEENV